MNENNIKYDYATGWISQPEASEFEQFFKERGFEIGQRSKPRFKRNIGRVRAVVLGLTIKDINRYRSFLAKYSRQEKNMDFKEEDMILIGE